MKFPANVIRPLGVSQVDDTVHLIYESKRRGNHKLGMATGQVGGVLKERAGSPMLVSSNGAPIDEELRYMRYAELGHKELITYSVKVGANWQWRIARSTPDWDLSLWESLPTNLNVTQGLLVSDSVSSDKALAVYIQNNLLHVASSPDLRKWDDESIICNLPHRSYLISATERPLGIVVVYANREKKGRKYVANIHTVLINREQLQEVDKRTNVAEIELNQELHEAIVGASINDSEVYIHSVDKKNKYARYEVPLDLYHEPALEHPYIPHRPKLVEVLEEPEPINPSTDVKVLMFGWELPPHHKGGLGVATYGLTKALLDCGAKITMILPRKKPVGDDSLDIRFAGVEKIQLQYFHTALQPYLTSQQYEAIVSGDLPQDEFASDLHAEVNRYAELAVQTAKEVDFDVIHTHDWLTLGAGVAVKKATGKPLVAHIHSTSKDMAGGGEVDRRIWQVEHDGLLEADKIVAVSEFTKQILVDLHSLDPDKIQVVHNGIDCRSYPPQQFAVDSELPALQLNHESYKTVLYVGRLTRHKGPDQFLDMAARVLQVRPHTHFVFAGSGDQEQHLIERAAELGISSYVHFAGWTSGKDLTRLYRSADLYVLPSVSEPFGITPLESIINGTPVLVSKQSGVSEVLASALKADFWDVEAMTQKTIAALDYPWLHKQLAAESLNEVRGLTWRKAAQKTLEVYSNTLNEVGAVAS